MKVFKRTAFCLVALQFVVLLLVLGLFKVDDMTLGVGEISYFNSGWNVKYESGAQDNDVTLPYNFVSARNEKVVFENTVTEDMRGKTLFFLSADKTVRVYIGTEEVYSFGENDVRLFGHTPGSVYCFINIPDDADNEIIRMEMSSYYENYATYMPEIRIADRDVAILTLLKENLLSFFYCVVIAMTGVVLFVLGIIQKLSKKEEDGMTYLGLVLILSAGYYSIETKILQIIYGNQTIYSYLVFMNLMLLPMLLLLYYMNNKENDDSPSFRIVLVLTFINIIVQIVLQLLNIRDFMEMAFVSHALIFLTVVVVLANYGKMARKKGRKATGLEMSALIILALGSIVDLGRTYVLKVGDLGKYSRISMMIFGLIMLFIHIKRNIKNEIKTIEENKIYLEKEVDRKTKEIRKLLVQSMNTLSNAVDAKDYYTNGHSIRVAEYSRLLAQRLGLSKERQEEIYYAGLLHDIGKIRVPDSIIKKEGKLTDEEYEYIKLHPVSGYHILKEISASSDIAIGAKYHHERYDGKGYPNGLEGENIPEIARILSVADAYDAMSSNRCYRKALPQDVVRAEIVKGRGTQFDPYIADIMLDIIDEDKDYRLKQNDEYHRTIAVVSENNLYNTVNSLLNHSDCVIEHYTEISEALYKCERGDIGLLLLDNDMDGISLKAISEKLSHLETSLIVMCDNHNLQEVIDKEKIIIDDYIVKPLNSLQLNEMVHSVLN